MSLPGLIAAAIRPALGAAGSALSKIFVRAAPASVVSKALVRSGPVIPGASRIHSALRPTSPLGRLAASSARGINLASLGTLLTGDTPGRGRGLKTAPRSVFNVNASQWGDIVGVGGYSPSHSYQAQVTPTFQSTLRRLAPIGLALAGGLGAYAVSRRKKKRRKRRGVRRASLRAR
jgi:hypothetical protein